MRVFSAEFNAFIMGAMFTKLFFARVKLPSPAVAVATNTVSSRRETTGEPSAPWMNPNLRPLLSYLGIGAPSGVAKPMI